MTTRKYIMVAVLGAVSACATEAADPSTTSTFAQDSNVHLKGGPRAMPSFLDNGLTLTANGDLSGLGNADVLVKLTAMGDPTATCTNPSGSRQPPGQNPAPVEITGTQAIPSNQIKNGSLHFAVMTKAPVTPIANAPDCPNTQWTEAITDMAFSDATITIEQPVGTIVLGVSCTFSKDTVNGPVPATQVTCTLL